MTMRLFRRPKTTNERRQSGRRGFIDVDGVLVKVRPSRQFWGLPSSYDDIHVSSRKDRSWKGSRNNQYRTSNP